MRRHALFLLCSLPVVGCGPAVEATSGDDSETTGTTGTGDGESGNETDDTGPPPARPSDQVDILFVVDDSGSMEEEQTNLAEAAGTFVDPLVDAGLSVRIAVTTTDDSNYWCARTGASDPESGQFVSSSCRTRLRDFSFSGGDGYPQAACTDFCELDSFELMPTTTAEDGNPAPRPWLEVGAGSSNLPQGISIGEALRCSLPQGMTGCGFESTLESARKALLLAGHANQDEYGFIREGAHLAIIFLTDEADCSFNRELQEVVFGEEGVGNQVFWSLPELQESPTSAVCWNAGVSCDFSLASEQCVSVDKSIDGDEGAAPDDAALYPVSKFRDVLEEIRAAKLPLGGDVFAFGIVGVPEDYPTTQVMSYQAGPDGSDPDSFQARFGIGQGCSSRVAAAVPPVRIREFVEGSSWGTNGKLYSVCNTSYAAALADIAKTLASAAP